MTKKILRTDKILLLEEQLKFKKIILKHFSLKEHILWRYLPPVIFFLLLFVIFKSHQFSIFSKTINILILYSFLPYLIYSLVQHKKVSQKIIETQYSYALENGEKWSNKTLKLIHRKIVKKRLKKLIKQKDKKSELTEQYLLFVLEAVKREKEISIKDYALVWILATIILSKVVDELSGLIKHIKTEKDLLFTVASVIIFVAIVFLIILLRGNWRNERRRRYTNLIRSIEDLYLKETAKI